MAINQISVGGNSKCPFRVDIDEEEYEDGEEGYANYEEEEEEYEYYEAGEGMFATLIIMDK